MYIADFDLEYDNRHFENCKAPFSLCSVLIDRDIVKDPYTNESQDEIACLLEKGFVAKAEFSLKKEDLSHHFARLVFTRVDTFCSIYLNGVLLDKTDNYHRRYCFDVAGLLQEGTNELVMKFFPALEKREKMRCEHFLAGSYRKSTPEHYGAAAEFVHWVRKPLYMLGWDWSPVLDDMGLYDVPELQLYDIARLEDFAVRQTHRNGTVTVDIEPEISFKRLGVKHNDALECLFEMRSPTGEIVKNFTGKFVIESPELWWPNGYGEQNLYVVTVSLYHMQTLLDSKSKNIGLRTVRFVDEDKADRHNCCFEVNGVKIFAMGANYVPMDCILTRETEEKQRRLIREARKANYNSLRIWGGGEYGSDALYDECDKQGILIWQDFMFACFMTYLYEKIDSTQRKEFEYQIKRIRSHASLGLLCGNNECAAMAYDWLVNETQKFGPKYAADYWKLYMEIIPSAVERLAPDIPYRQASPCVSDDFGKMGTFLSPDINENYGDRHCWEVWHGRKHYLYFAQHKFPFLSEFGFMSLPQSETLNAFAEGSVSLDDLPIASRIKCRRLKENYSQFVGPAFNYPKTLEEWSYASRVYQARAMDCAIRSMRKNRGDCMGTYMWQLNDCWPCVSHSVTDYYFRWKPAQYAAKKSYAPVLLTAEKENGNVRFYLCNETRNDCEAVIEYFYSDAYFSRGEMKMITVRADACSSVSAALISVPGNAEKQFLCYRLKLGGKVVSESSLLFTEEKEFPFAEPIWQKSIVRGSGGVVLEIACGVYTKDVFLESPLDIFFEENYFDVCNALPKKIVLYGGEKYTDEEILGSLRIYAYNIYSDAYRCQKNAM